MLRLSVLIVSLIASSAALSVARASPTDGGEERPELALRALSTGMALPATLAAAADPELRAIAIATGGYDAAVRAAIARVVGDIHVFGPIDVRLGMTYLGGVGSGESQFQPQIGLRVRLLTTEREGLDLALGAFYHRERYTGDDGMLQAVVAIGRRWERFSVIANLAYGQDPEGDDRDGDVSLAALYRVSLPLQVALESHLRFDIDSEDPRRKLRGQGPFDLQVGPIVQYTIGPAILTAQTGLSAMRFQRTHMGLYALGGIGGVY